MAKYGPTMRVINDARQALGLHLSDKPTHRQIWEIARAIEGYDDDAGAIGWLQFAPHYDADPVIGGYLCLCEALNAPDPEADAILDARMVLATPSFRMACHRFLMWWYKRSDCYKALPSEQSRRAVS